MNRKIPITSNEPFIFDDTENGIRYFIRPCTGRTSMRFSTVLEMFGSGSTLDKSDAICETVDTFVCGRESLDRSAPIPDFPRGLRASDFLDTDTIINLFNEILRINGFSNEEKKSSSQLQTSSSEVANTDKSTTAMRVNTGTKKGTAVRSKKRNS